VGVGPAGCLTPALTHLATQGVVGWRVHQAADLGVGGLLRTILDEATLGDVAEGSDEPTPRTGHRTDRLSGALDTDSTVLRLFEAAIRLGREDLVAKSLSTLAANLLSAHSSGWNDLSWEQLRGVLDMIEAAFQSLEQIDGVDVSTLASTVCTHVIRRIKQVAKAVDDDHDISGHPLTAPLVTVGALLRVASRVDQVMLRRAETVARRVVTFIAGDALHRTVLLGGDAEKVAQLLEAIGLLSLDKRRPWYRVAAIQLFDEIAYTRLYVTGAIAQQPGNNHRIVRPFAANHIDGQARTCTTLAWLRALHALRPVFVTEAPPSGMAPTKLLHSSETDETPGTGALGRLAEIDRVIERIAHNALLVVPGTDPRFWLGPIPHGIDRNEECDLFGDQQGHQFAPGPWRPNLRSSGTVEQCCAASALVALALVPASCISSSADQLIVHQLIPGETVGEGWELSVTGGWPFEADVSITVHTDRHRTFFVRIPDWHEPDADVSRGHLELQPSRWMRIDVTEAEPCRVQLEFPSVPRLVSAHPLHSDIRGCVAMLCGPFVYCLEGADQMGHSQPRQVRFDANGAVSVRRETEHPEAYPTIHATGEWRTRDSWPEYAGHGLLGYRWWRPEPMDLPVDLTFVPFYSIANRGLWEMAVWIPLAVPSDL
jgi:hypothetical protein